MQNRRALAALWVVCVAVIGWVWLHPLHEGALPPPVARAARKARPIDPAQTPVAQPEDEPIAEEPAAQPVQSGPPEMLDRHDLENAMLKIAPKAMQCQAIEQFIGSVQVRLVIKQNGS